MISVPLDVWQHSIDVILTGFATIGGKRGVRCNSIAPGVVLTRAALANAK